MSLHVKLVTPDRVLFELEALSISLPTETGEITVLPHHTALATVLTPGIVHVKAFLDGKSHEEEIAVSGGFVHVHPNGEVKILADTAERGEELNIDVIEEAKKRAEDVMKNTANKDDVAFAMAAAGLERELARFKLAMKYKRKQH